MNYDEIRAAESTDPILTGANAPGEIGDPTAGSGDLLEAGGSLLEQDAIAKVNAGAQLTFAVWSLPKDIVLPLMRDAPQAFQHAYMAALNAYGIGGR